MTPSTLGARLGIAAAGAFVLGFGGLSAAALNGSLPDTAQDVIRPLAGAPADDDTDTRTTDDTQDSADDAAADTKGTKRTGVPTGMPTGVPTTAVGPDASGPAAFGLCTAHAHGKDAGKTAERSVAVRNLVTAAGGEDKVEAYCAAVEHPSAHATGNPTDPPSSKAKNHPTGKSSSHPTGKPDSRPGSPQGKPSGAGAGAASPGH